ncbi:MAG: 4-(cytidine 5'-diphospho)-2-C-methyl-D-erythritol kinase [Acuticoccus sp.]
MLDEAVAARRVVVTARAKVNLALHVVGQRADGYHLLDSIVAFAALRGTGGDVLTIDFAADAAGEPAFAVSGPFAHDVPHGPGNSALAAAEAVGGIRALTLEKNLPVAAGIGGGSADAAAVLRAAAYQTGHPLAALGALALSLGADVPVCLAGTPARMGGIGEALSPIGLPETPCVLVNPRAAVATPAVFRALAKKDNPPLAAGWPAPRSPAALAAALAEARNDLGPPAARVAPVIDKVVAALAGEAGCLLARMSGSGATVFGLFADAAASERAAAALRVRHPGWWITPAVLEGAAG